MANNASFASFNNASFMASSSRALSSPNDAGRNSTTAHWSLRDRDEQDSQTDGIDSMRRLLDVYDENIAAIRAEVLLAEEAARARLVQWEATLKYNLWLWDAAAAVVRDTEARARRALVDSEQQWRDTFLAFAVELFLGDDTVPHPSPSRAAKRSTAADGVAASAAVASADVEAPQELAEGPAVAQSGTGIFL
jgi:hypothetical protein